MIWISDAQSIKWIVDLGIVLITSVLMLGVGMELDLRQFRKVAAAPKNALLLFAWQALLLPLAGIAVVTAWSLPPHISAGILLVAACPVGDIANFYTLLARGNTALALTLNLFSCLICSLTMALTFGLYSALFPEHFLLAVPTFQVVLRLVLILVLPVLSGMAIRWRFPVFATRHRTTMRNLSFIGVAILIAHILTSRYQQLTVDWKPAVLGSISFLLLAFLVGLAAGNFLRLQSSDQITSGIVFAARNVGLATAVAVTLLGKLEYALFAAVYFLIEVPLLLLLVEIYRRSRARRGKLESATGLTR